MNDINISFDKDFYKQGTTPDTSVGSSTYTDYKSDYDTDIDIDKAYKNKLYNSMCDEEELFKLKNDFFVHYGSELYNKVMENYMKDIAKYDFTIFDQGLWNKCLELYKNPKEDIVKCFCFQVKFNKPYDNRTINDTYTYLIKMKIKNIKIKVWLNSVKCTLQ